MKIWTHCFKSIDESAFLGMMRAVKGKENAKKRRGEKETLKPTQQKFIKKITFGAGRNFDRGFIACSPFFFFLP